MTRVESPAPKTGDDLMERQIKAAGADKAPRVTPADIKGGGPAFPLQSIGPDFAPGYSGMTLRDYFAANAMQSLAMHEEYPPLRAALTAYEYADAMLKAREA